MENSKQSSSPVIDVSGVSFAYNGETVLTDADFKVDAHDYVSVVGPNGGGKTTLVKLLLGLLKPKTGKIQVLGTTPERARRKVGYVPQHFASDSSFPVRVMDVVLMGRQQGLSKIGGFNRHDRSRAMAALERVGLADIHRRHFSQLSGGQRQRVLIARALAGEPKLLILDEPTAHVDQEVERTILHFLKEFNREMTIFMVTHDVTFVSSFVKTVLCVNRTVRIHSTAEVPTGMHIELFGGDVRYVKHDHRDPTGRGHHHHGHNEASYND